MSKQSGADEKLRSVAMNSCLFLLDTRCILHASLVLTNEILCVVTRSWRVYMYSELGPSSISPKGVLSFFPFWFDI
jgi:hypothetical protein